MLVFYLPIIFLEAMFETNASLPDNNRETIVNEVREG